MWSCCVKDAPTHHLAYCWHGWQALCLIILEVLCTLLHRIYCALILQHGAWQWKFDSCIKYFFIVLSFSFGPWHQDNSFQHVPASVECKEVVSATGRVQYGSPSTPVNSAGGSAQSEVSGHTFVSEEINSIDYNVSGNGETKPFMYLPVKLTW